MWLFKPVDFMLGFIKKYARASIERPSLAKAFVFFLLPFILQMAFLVVIGASINFGAFSFNAFFELVGWVLSALLLYFIVHLFKGREVSGKFKGFVAGLAMRYVFLFFLMLLVFLVIFFVVPEFFGVVSRFSRAATAEESFALLSENIDSISQKNELLFFSGFGLILLGTVLVIFLILFLAYQLIALSGSGSPRKNLLILVVWVLVQAVISVFLIPAF